MRCERGQAGVETLLVLPLLLLATLAGTEAATWVASDVLVGDAAGAGARALARGDPAAAAARAELPAPLREHAHVTIARGVVTVVIRIPSLVPAGPSFAATASAGS
jgi:hypothetical protein